MNEQHFDALPPVNLSQQPDQQVKPAGGEVPSSTETGQGGAPMGAPIAPMIDPAAAAVPPLADPLTTAALSSAIIADDVDLIEKEWIDKAKQIVEQTKHDPYQQNEAITQVKTDYLKKRYNRDIRKSEA